MHRQAGIGAVRQEPHKCPRQGVLMVKAKCMPVCGACLSGKAGKGTVSGMSRQVCRQCLMA